MAAEVSLHLRAALAARDVGASSDFDLNPAVVLPENRVLRPASVLVAIQHGPAGPQVILTKRASHLRHHPGQIAFPGGRQDADDRDAVDTALREAREEIGLPDGAVEVLGRLPPHETVTGFQVTPIVAQLTRDFTPCPEPGEVAEIFCAPLSHLTDPARFRIERRIWRGTWRNFYIVPWGPYYIWGATARILRGLADRMDQCKP
ncbi:CoA pyrophosphatase [Roseinatronobacter sp. S2]|uniref:CoA pyrophosphatase n=1 Tax=Roseinatronobacter sp. S2 TaxID=3035471 RepID=UPI002795F171|nr:CoA pyrophosphatase [Roseinatronobacter sp. S2]